MIDTCFPFNKISISYMQTYWFIFAQQIHTYYTNSVILNSRRGRGMHGRENGSGRRAGAEKSTAPPTILRFVSDFACGIWLTSLHP